MTDNTHGPTHKRTMTTNKATELPTFPKYDGNKAYHFIIQVQQWRGTMTQGVQAILESSPRLKNEDTPTLDDFKTFYTELRFWLLKLDAVLGALEP